MITVLVVEDKPNVRKLVVVNLISRGYAVLEATNVPQALDHLNTAAPDLMILDIKLPEMTGWDLLAQIAADPNIAGKFPVLVDCFDHGSAGRSRSILERRRCLDQAVQRHPVDDRH